MSDKITNERIVAHMVKKGWHERTAERMVEKGKPGSWEEPLPVAATRLVLAVHDLGEAILRQLPYFGKRL